VPLEQFSTSFLDERTDILYLADRSNKAIDVIDTRTERFLYRVAGFAGVTDSGGDTFGPNGVLTVNDSFQALATDGDSTVKVIDLKTGTIIASFTTGGRKRANEMAYDPKNRIVIVTNPDDEPPFLTLVSTKPGYEIIAKVALPQATRHIERAVYFPPTGNFFVDIPVLDNEPAKGGLAEIAPGTGRLVKMHVIENCNPHGLSYASGTLLFVGCAAGSSDSGLANPQMAVFDTRTGKLSAAIAGVGGAGQTAVDIKIGRYYAAANNHPEGPTLAVIDAAKNTLLQKVPTWKGSHSVAVNPNTSKVYLAARAGSEPCGGCVLVFAPE
jgi:DNA-binding beta-propeller fold protein YncE